MNATALSTFRFPENTCISQAQPKTVGQVTLKSPATAVMTDLSLIKAVTIEASLSLTKAEQTMIQQGVRSLFVVNDYPCVDGLVTVSDIVGDKPMRQVTQRGIQHQDLSVADVMTPLSQLEALDYDETKAASVGQIVATFKQVKQSHLLVVQPANHYGPARIRGLISLTQLERQLGRSIHDLPVE